MTRVNRQWLPGRVIGCVLVVLLIVAPVPPVTVSTAQGLGYTCNEAGLDAALAAGSTAAAPATFACIGTNPTITVSAQKSVTRDVALDGGGILVISGGGAVGVFTVNTGVAFTVQHLTITQGYSIAGGGIVNNGGTLTVTDCTLSGNTSTANDSNLRGGGAIFSISGLVVTNSRFTGNVSMGYGGAIFNLTGDVTLTGSTLAANRAVNGGGGVYTTSFISQNGTLAVTDSLFSGNTVSGGGAAGIHVYHTAATITRTAFSSNVLSTSLATSPDAGGIINDGGKLAVVNSAFTGGAAYEAGGIFNTTGGTATISDTTFSANRAVDGSAIVNGGVAGGGPVTGTVTLTGSTLTKNGNGDSADGSIVNRGGTLTVLNSTIAGEDHTRGAQSGAIWNDANSALTLRNSTLSGNTGGGATGGIINSRVNTTARVQNSLIVNNSGAAAGNANTDVEGLTLDSTNLTGAFTFADPNPKTPADHGGPTATFALPPGSPAIGAGDPAICATAPPNGAGTVDQRGITRAVCDLGAFASQGFAFANPTGGAQRTVVTAPFAAPLALTVTSAHAEPVTGGVLTFTISPGADGASATFAASGLTGCGIINGNRTAICPVTNGTATTPTLRANATVGSFTVVASAAGVPAAGDVTYSLTNAPIPPQPPTHTPASTPGGLLAPQPDRRPAANTPVSGTPGPQPSRH